MTQSMILLVSVFLSMNSAVAHADSKAPTEKVAIRNAKVVKPKLDLKVLMATKNPPVLAAGESVYPKCSDGRMPYVVSQKNGDFCCKQDSYGCQSWKTCDYYEGQCTGGGVVSGAPYNCTPCDGAGAGAPAEVQAH